MALRTADLYDDYGEDLQVADSLFQSFGQRTAFSGCIVTVRVFEDNSLVREILQQPGHNKVLVVDGGGSLRCALIGDQLAQLAIDSGWEGALINGCVRDTETLSILPIGIKALNTNPRRSVKHGQGERDIAVQFAGVTFNPRHYLYADPDGIVVAASSLEPAPTVLV